MCPCLYWIWLEGFVPKRPTCVNISSMTESLHSLTENSSNTKGAVSFRDKSLVVRIASTYPLFLSFFFFLHTLTREKVMSELRGTGNNGRWNERNSDLDNRILYYKQWLLVSFSYMYNQIVDLPEQDVISKQVMHAAQQVHQVFVVHEQDDQCNGTHRICHWTSWNGWWEAYSGVHRCWQS